MMRIHSLHVYPVKAARGIALERATCLRQGLEHDRRFMVVDAHGKFVTQRTHPRMALVDVALVGDALLLAAGERRAELPLDPARALPGAPRRRVHVWDAETEAVEVTGEGSRFFTDHLGEPCTLVYMPLDARRDVEEPYSQRGDRVGFADAYPVLLASLASLAELNARLVAAGEAPVGIDRFRANVVIEGGEAYAEDLARTAHVGALSLRTPKRCARCVVITTDQVTGARSKEPLRTLARYRSEGGKVYFGTNAIPDLDDEGHAPLAIGDEIAYRG